MLALAAIPAGALFAQGCFPGWNYHCAVTIDNSTNSTALVDYQVKILLNTGALVAQSKLNSDGSDLRFSEQNCTPLHFYMDSAATSTQNVIWVKVPLVPANGSLVIDMYYGNTGASSAANGDSTFIFFDDFEDATIDMNKWVNVGAYSSWTEAAGSMDYLSTPFASASRWKFVESTMSFSSPVYIDLGLNQNFNNALFGFSSADSALERYCFRAVSNPNDTLRIIHFTDTTSNGAYFPGTYDYPWFSVPFNTQRHLVLRAETSGGDLLLTEFTDLVSMNSNTTPWTLSTFNMSAFQLCFSTFSNSDAASVQYVKVRRGEVPDPPTSVSPETVITGLGAASSAGNAIRVSPNPSNGTFTLELPGSGTVQLLLHNAGGRCVHTATLNGGTRETLDLKLPAGVYFMSLSSSEFREIKKIVVQE